MTIAIFATEALTLQGVVSALTDEGLDVRAFEPGAPGSTAPPGPEVGKGVLIFPKHGAGETTSRVSRLLGGGRRLILCAPQPDGEGRELLKSMGAAEVITPRTWEPAHVAERVLAQLILEGDVTPSVFGSIQGATRVMRDLYEQIQLMAPHPYPVLVLGETGTGKELVAGEIHKHSGRPGECRVANCGEFSPDLIRSELFGHKKGAFTGAVDTRRGMLVEAGHGTFFLDEIGELDLRAQATLLRVIEDKKVRPVGATLLEDAPARLVLATNRDLELEREEGRFKQDLLARIRGLTLELRPLRERRADIPLLVRHFLKEFTGEGKPEPRVPDGAIDCLFNYEWPDNVRELQGVVRAAAIEGKDGFISGRVLLEATQRGRKRKQKGGAAAPEQAGHYVPFDPETDTRKDFLARAEAAYFKAVLAAAGGNKTEAARRAGMSVSQFYKKLEDIS